MTDTETDTEKKEKKKKEEKKKESANCWFQWCLTRVYFITVIKIFDLNLETYRCM